MSVYVPIHSLYESKSHLVNAVEDALDSPTRELVGIVSDFLRQHSHHVLIQVLSPVLPFGVPFWQYEQVGVFFRAIGLLGVTVYLAPYTHDKAILQSEEVVLVAKSDEYLVFSILIGIF